MKFVFGVVLLVSLLIGPIRPILAAEGESIVAIRVGPDGARS